MAICYKVKNLSFKYKNDKDYILENLNLEIKYANITLIKGLSGSGKSSLIYALTKISPEIIPADITGDIFLDNINLKNLTLKDITKKVGIVFQNPSEQIIFKESINEFVFGMENLNYSKEKITNNIIKYQNLFNIDFNKYTKNLSSGEKQKLISSSILAMENKIVIFDEPFANLDYLTINNFIEIIKYLKNNNYAVIIMEHRIDKIIDVADEIYEIKGKNIEKIKLDLKTYLLEQKNICNIKNDLTSNEIIFQVSNLNYQIENRLLFDNFNLELNKLDKLLITGLNGTGKTTLIRILLNLCKYKKNINYFFDGKKYKLSNKIYKHVSYVYQNPNYQLFMKTVYEEIKLNSKNQEVMDYLINFFDIKNLLNRHPHSLSEGQKRKVTLISGLVKMPKIIFLDEPTTGQDDHSVKKIIQVLDYFNRKYNLTIVAISHDFRFNNLFFNKKIELK